MSGQPQLEPPTERVGGGLSARVPAVVIGATLVAVIWFGATGRPDPQAPSPLPSPLAVASPPARTSPPPTLAAPTAEPETAPTFDVFGVTLSQQRRFFQSTLREIEPGRLTGVLRVPFTQSTATARIDIVRLWTDEERATFVRLSRHHLPADWLSAGGVPYRLVHAEVGPRADALPRIARQGYVLNIDVEHQDDHALLIVELITGPARLGSPHFDSTVPAPELEARLVDGDQLHSRVGLGGRPPGVMTAHVIVHQRYGPNPTLLLASPHDDGVTVLASIELERRLLLRGYPDQFSGDFTHRSGEGDESTWRYRITPHGVAAGVLLLIEVELQDPKGSWTCWSHGVVC